ncbi:MAG: hypothetical protein M3022_00640 [Actinomycetota bacterium]|nr:hypothetical protein [Actinomycetota bacterium]
MPEFAQMLEARGVLMADGALGTNFQDMGIEPGSVTTSWWQDRWGRRVSSPSCAVR